MKYLLFVNIYLFSLSINAQIITIKNAKYGITDILTGDLLVEQQYDSIYQLCFRPRVLEGSQDKQAIPIFACLKHKQIQLYNSNSGSFYPGIFEEIKLYRQMDEQSYGLNPPAYIPYWVDCFMLRRREKWGFISYKKEYSFRDRLENSDTFRLIEPQYDDLKFVEEEFGYESKMYAKRRRIVAARKDSLWGALSFETAEVIVPFLYPLPIHSFFNSYDNRGLEFLSTTGGFIPYYIARKGRETMPQIVINPMHPELSWEFDFLPNVRIYNEFSGQFLYVEPEKKQEGYFKLFEYNSGKPLLTYKRDHQFSYFQTHRKVENILVIDESSPYEKLFRQTWFNLTNGEVILFAEGKSYHDTNMSLSKGNNFTVMKGRKAIGKIVGDGKEMRIVWLTRKAYIKSALK